jgi:hypothetical protein
MRRRLCKMPLASVFARQRLARHASVPVIARHKPVDIAVGTAGSLSETEETGRSGLSKVPECPRSLAFQFATHPHSLVQVSADSGIAVRFAGSSERYCRPTSGGGDHLLGRSFRMAAFAYIPERGQMRRLQLIGWACATRPTSGEGGDLLLCNAPDFELGF